MRWLALAWLALVSSCVVEERVHCINDSQCPAAAPFCDLNLHACQTTAFGSDGGGGDAAPTSCVMNKDCGAAAPICDHGTCRGCVMGEDGLCQLRSAATPYCAPNGQCAQCAKNMECTQTGKPICDPATFQCRACLNSDCPSGVCNKAMNTCVLGGTVLTVDASQCPTPSPPVYCTLQAAVTAAGAISSIKYIVVKGNSMFYPANVTIMNDITIIGPYSDAPPSTSPTVAPATLTSKQDGAPVLSITGTAHVVLDGLVILGGTKAGGRGVICNAQQLSLLRSSVTSNFDVGVEADSPCNLVIDQCIIGATKTSNGNLSGGIKIVDAPSTIQNSWITGNGNMNSNIQAITYSFTAAPPQQVFYNNTVADNQGGSGTAGVQCLGVSAGTTIGFYDTIFWQNYANPVAGRVLSETSGFCLGHYSATDDSLAFGGDHIVKLGGANPPPGFAASGDYHLQMNSACVAQGTTVSAPLYDIDGDLRGSMNDIGADQH